MKFWLQAKEVKIGNYSENWGSIWLPAAINLTPLKLLLTLKALDLCAQIFSFKHTFAKLGYKLNLSISQIIASFETVLENNDL